MTIDIEVAEQFGALVAEGNYREAHGYLTQAAGRENPPEVLKRDFEEMISYWQEDGEILEERLPSVVEVRSDLILEDWPDKQAQDLGMVYTAFIGAGNCEAVTVVLTSEDGAVRIRSLEWGRP